MIADLQTQFPGLLVPRTAPRWLHCARAVVYHKGVVQVMYDYDELGVASLGDAGFEADIVEALLSGVLLFTRHIDRQRFWRDVQAHRTVVWETTARCVIGLALRPPDTRLGCLPVYDFAMLQRLAYTTVDCADQPTDEVLQARVLNYLQTNMLDWADPDTAPVFEMLPIE